MKCENCNSSWDSSVALEKCPFCGELLNKKELVVADVSSALKKIISENTISIFDTPKVVISLVADYLEGFQREKKLLRIACSNGALKYVSEISKETDKEQQQILIKKLNTLLIDDAFLSEENATLILGIMLNSIDIENIVTVNNKCVENDNKSTIKEVLTDVDNFTQKNSIRYNELPLYKETIQRIFHGEGKVKSMISGYEEYAGVNIRFEPTAAENIEFVDCDTECAIPKGMVPAIEKGLRDMFKKGPLAGYPVVGVKAVLTGGSYHPVYSNSKAFEKAARIAYEECCKNGAPILLEKIVKVRAKILEDAEQTRAIMRKVSDLRGRVLELNDLKNSTWCELKFEMPMSAVDDITNFIKSKFLSNEITDIQFSCYDKLHGPEADIVINKNKSN